MNKKYNNNKYMNIESLDLNLLKVLIAIYEERKITAAADRLGLTQPGVSHALGRLRDLYRDELFVRGVGGMTPTALAHDLYARVRPAFDGLRAGLAMDGPLDPVEMERDVVLGMNDYGSQVILPELIRRVSATAPRVRVRTRHYAHGTQMEDLRSGVIDLSITVAGELPGWCNSAPLFTETAVVIADPKNSKINRTLTPTVYAACPHVVMAASGEDRTWVDDVLADHDLTRSVQHTVPHFLALPSIIAGTEMIGTVPRRIAESLARDDQFTIYTFPFDQQPHQLVQCWPRRRDRDPVHVWLGSIVSEIADTLS
jgi:DNA-binding transcriptional LysR family regulator